MDAEFCFSGVSDVSALAYVGGLAWRRRRRAWRNNYQRWRSGANRKSRGENKAMKRERRIERADMGFHSGHPVVAYRASLRGWRRQCILLASVGGAEL